MSEYQNVIGGEAEAEGESFGCQGSGVKKKKKKKQQHRKELSQIGHDELHEDIFMNACWLVAGGLISSSMDKTKGSPCQQGYLESSQAGKMMRHSIPNLPEDIWRHIHSLVPLRDAACASCVSRAFLHSWRCRPNLILNRDTLRSKAHVSGVNFSHTLDCILRRHSGVGVKTLQLVLDDIANNGDLDSWLQVAVAPGIEELILMPISGMIKYNFPCSLLSEGIRNSIRLLTLGYCAFRPTLELGPLRSLTSLCLDTVGITGYELECFFSPFSCFRAAGAHGLPGNNLSKDTM